jgi:hypothetical protein
MSLLAALVLAAASARVESVSLTTVDSRLAVRVLYTGTPGMVAVHREGDVARVSIMDAELGLRFAGGRRFSWTPSDGFDPALLAATPAKLDRIEIAAGASEVSVLLRVPPDVSVDVRRGTRGLLLVFRTAPVEPEPERVARAMPPAVVPAPEPTPTPPPAVAPPAPEPAVTAPPTPEPTAPEPTRAEPVPAIPPAAPPAPLVSAPAVAEAAPATPPPPADTTELAKRLFPAGAAGAQAATTGTVAELYPQLFPTGVPQAAPEEPLPEVTEIAEEAGVALGPFRIRASVDARFVDADTFVESTATPTEDTYAEIQPRILAVAPVGEGRFTLDYGPVFRAFATYDDVNSSSHALSAGLDLPVGSRVSLRATDRFQSGVLDTRVVDPGGEYFFGLGHFRRNDASLGASIVVGPRLSVELGGSMGTVSFQDPANFFPYETWSGSAGLGFEVTPTVKAVASYVYDTVPRPDERPEAESTAHSARLSLSGELLPLLTGELTVGYRDQTSPNAGPGGTGYSGFVMSAGLTRQLGTESALGIYASRTTPVSAFEANAFYVSSSLQGTLQAPLPARFQLQGGLGYQWNDYRTVASEIGAPREDRILGWYVGLRRPVRSNLFLSGVYRSEDRRSNVDEFDTDADGFYLQLEWDVFGAPPR